MKRILTFGVFDILHLGHILLFKNARELGDYLIVAVQSEECVLKYKPTAKLVNNTEERLIMVSSIKYVNEVLVYNDVDKDVQTIDFDVLVKGPDQNHDGFRRAEKWCKENGKEIIVIPRTEGISSSMLRKLI